MRLSDSGLTKLSAPQNWGPCLLKLILKNNIQVVVASFIHLKCKGYDDCSDMDVNVVVVTVPRAGVSECTPIVQG